MPSLPSGTPRSGSYIAASCRVKELCKTVWSRFNDGGLCAAVHSYASDDLQPHTRRSESENLGLALNLRSAMYVDICICIYT